MFSGNIDISKKYNISPFESLLPAHFEYIEIGTVETDSLKICIIVEIDITEKSIADNYYGQTISQKEYKELKVKILNWSLQSVFIEQFKIDNHIEVIRNHQDTCALFVLPKDNILYFHWDPVELYQYLDISDLLNIKATISQLEFLECRKETTSFKNLFRILERGHLIFKRNSFEIIKPPHIDPIEAVPLKDGVDPIDTFYDIISQNIVRRPIVSSKVSSILSSGLDTSIVAYFLQEKIFPNQLNTFGYCGIDKNREAIKDMRLETLKHLGCNDYYPNVEDKIDEGFSLKSYAWWTDQSEVDFAENMLARKMQYLGISLATTGVGGDEIGMLTDKELIKDAQKPRQAMSPGNSREEYYGFSLVSEKFKSKTPEFGELRWPDGYAAESVSDMANAFSFLYLRHGVWLINPLAAAEVQIFSKFLPAEWRKNRHISREALKRLGWSENFIKQLPKESLIGTLQTMLQNNVEWDKIFNNSILCELGIIDKKHLFNSINIIKKKFNSNIAMKLIAALKLELSIQSVYAAQKNKSFKYL